MGSASGNSDPWIASELPEKQVSWLKEYFVALDSETDDGAKTWTGSFLEDGELVQGDVVFKGPEVLLQERYRVWKMWPGLYHVVKSIFVAPGNEKMNFLVVASYAIKHPNGSLVERDTAANYHLVEQNGELKIKTLEIYADPRPLLALLGGDL